MHGRGWDMRDDPAGEIVEAVRLMIARNPVEPFPIRHEPSDKMVVFHLGSRQQPITSVTVSQTMLTECTREVYDLVLGRFMDSLRAVQRGAPPMRVEPDVPAPAPDDEPADGRTRAIEVE